MYIPDSVTFINTVLFQERFGSLRYLRIGAGIDDTTLQRMLYCWNLEWMDISENHPSYCSIEGVVYNKELTYVVFYPYWKDEFHQVPDTVTDIQAIIDALANSDGAIDFAIGPNVEGYVMEDNVLYDLDKTEIFYVNKQAEGEYVMPDSVVYINDRAFAGSGFSKVTVSPSVTQITYCAFIGSVNLTDVQLPEQLETIEEAAFAECYNLQNVSIGENVTSIGYNAFKYCDNLNRVDIQSVDAWCNIWFDGRNANPLYRAGDLYMNGEKLEVVDLTGVRVNYIQQYAFIGLNAQKVIIPGNIARICYEAFRNAKISQVELNEGLEYIGESAFTESTLTAITLPDTLRTMDQSAFACCYSLTEINLGAGLTEIPAEAFVQTGVQSLIIPQQITYIGDKAFAACSSLESVIFDAEDLTVSQAAFYDCPIRNLSLENVLSIGDYAFANHQTPYLKIPAGMKYLGEGSLGFSSYLRGVEIPADMQSLRCLNGSDRLEHVLYKGAEEQWEKLIYAGDAKIAPTTVHCNATGNEVYPTDTGYSCSLCDFHVTVEKDEPELPALYISRQPESVTVAKGEMVQISLEAVGEGLTYKWYYANAGTENFKVTYSFTGNTYSLAMTAAMHGRRVYCVVTDMYGNQVTTDIVTMTIGVACEHDFADATCTEPKTCKRCGATEGGALGHSYNVVVTEPTCTADGYTTYTCSGCGDSYVADPVNAPGHDFADATLTAPKTCKVCGATEGEPLKPVLEITKQPESVTVAKGEMAEISFEAVGEGLTYTWYYANAGAEAFKITYTFKGNTYSLAMTAAMNGRRVYCVVTDMYGNQVTTDIVTMTIGVACEHDFADATCTEPKVCKLCGATEGDALGHSYNAVVTEPTCTADGYTTYTCTGCGDTYVADPVKTSGHDFADATCTDPKVCKLCGATEGDALGHSYNVVVTEPTCTADGYTTYTCTGCGDTYVADPVKTSGHDFADATLTAPKTCKVCGATEGEPLKPVLEITKQPESVTVAKGEVAQISFEAVGEGLTYTWYYANKGAESFKVTYTYKSNVYSIAMTAAMDGRRVYCVVTDKYGQTVTTDVVTLELLVTETPLTITRQPESVVVAKGDMAEISFEATGDDLTYTWYYANKGVENFKVTNTYKSNVYSMPMTAAMDGRRVYCVVTDAHGNQVQTDIVTLELPAATTPLTITRQPTDGFAEKGKMAEISFEATGDGLTYTWYYANKGAESFKVTYTYKSNVYNIALTAAMDGRRVYCVVTDAYGNQMQTDIVTLHVVYPAAITRQPESVVVAKGDMAEISFEATGDDLTYTWYYANKGAESFKVTYTYKSNVYSIAMTAAMDGRRVYCVVTDKYGNQVQTDVVTLSLPTANPLTITRQPESVTVAKGEMAQISFEAVGDGLTYRWYYANAGEENFKVTYSFTGNTYSLPMTAAMDGRQVYCVVTDQYGNQVQTETVTLTLPKAATLEIARQPESVTVAKGEMVQISFEAVGEGLTYKWYYANAGTENFKVTYSFTGNSYSLAMTAAMDGRRVYCVITDQYGQSVTTDVVTMTMG